MFVRFVGYLTTTFFICSGIIHHNRCLLMVGIFLGTANVAMDLIERRDKRIK